MSKNSADTTAAIMAADQIVWRIDQIVCDQCEDICWTLEGHAEGALGDATWRTSVAWREHVTLTQALLALRLAAGRNADKVRSRELAIRLIETHPTLW